MRPYSAALLLCSLFSAVFADALDGYTKTEGAWILPLTKKNIQKPQLFNALPIATRN
uniref:Uncharacterized protein n=1 Tax=Anguilla anguilla TaxID=7936 RepID=A0A0E9WNS7_ANGAN